MDSNRIEYLDAAKAIGIFLVILGHCFNKVSVPYLHNFICSFHMPLFFRLLYIQNKNL